MAPETVNIQDIGMSSQRIHEKSVLVASLVSSDETDTLRRFYDNEQCAGHSKDNFRYVDEMLDQEILGYAK